jgi:hypothetical protein
MLKHINEDHHGGVDRIWTMEDRKELSKDPHGKKHIPH